MIFLVTVSDSGAREQGRLPQEAPESVGVCERVPLGAPKSTTWATREQGGGHLGHQRVVELRRGEGILSTGGTRERWRCGGVEVWR